MSWSKLDKSSVVDHSNLFTEKLHLYRKDLCSFFINIVSFALKIYDQCRTGLLRARFSRMCLRRKYVFKRVTLANSFRLMENSSTLFRKHRTYLKNVFGLAELNLASFQVLHQRHLTRSFQTTISWKTVSVSETKPQRVKVPHQQSPVARKKLNIFWGRCAADE